MGQTYSAYEKAVSTKSYGKPTVAYATMEEPEMAPAAAPAVKYVKHEGPTPFTPSKLFGWLVIVSHVVVWYGLAKLATSNGLGHSSTQLYDNYLGVCLRSR